MTIIFKNQLYLGMISLRCKIPTLSSYFKNFWSFYIPIQTLLQLRNSIFSQRGCPFVSYLPALGNFDLSLSQLEVPVNGITQCAGFRSGFFHAACF
jgi:hypothetical protein